MVRLTVMPVRKEDRQTHRQKMFGNIHKITMETLPWKNYHGKMENSGETIISQFIIRFREYLHVQGKRSVLLDPPGSLCFMNKVSQSVS